MSTRTVESLSGSEAFLRKQLLELDLLCEHAPVGMALLDADLRYLRVNEILAMWR